MDRCEQALAASEQAVTVYRALAAAHLDAFTPHLATPLNTLPYGWPTWTGGRRQMLRTWKLCD